MGSVGEEENSAWGHDEWGFVYGDDGECVCACVCVGVVHVIYYYVYTHRHGHTYGRTHTHTHTHTHTQPVDITDMPLALLVNILVYEALSYKCMRP